MYLFAMYIYLSALDSSESEYGLHELASLRAYQTSYAEDLALPYRKSYILEGMRIRLVSPSTLNISSSMGLWLLGGEPVAHLTAYHAADDGIRGHL